MADSLVEEGEQVSHDDEGFAWQGLQDLSDVNGPLLEALHRWNTHVTVGEVTHLTRAEREWKTEAAG